MKSLTESLLQIAGYYGTRPLSGTTPKNCKAVSFQAFEDTVIASVKDESGTERISEIQSEIEQGFKINFGFITSQITLTSGRGQYYNYCGSDITLDVPAKKQKREWQTASVKPSGSSD